MTYNISKELLYEVLDKRKGSITIDIYELAHKCKEWALKQRHILHSSIDEIGKGYLKVDHFTEELYGESVKTFTADTEQQAVFDACQWILDIKESELTNNEDFVTKLSGALFQIANLIIKDK